MKIQSIFLNIALCVLLPATACLAGQTDQLSKLIVKGEASVFKPADQMEVSLGVVTVNEDSSLALIENNRKMHQIIANLQALRLDEQEYQTGRFHIHPVYKTQTKYYEEIENPKISHYEVLNTIQVKTLKLDLADQILQEAVRGGANQIDQVNFTLFNPQIYREEVIKLATQNALSDAFWLSQAAGVKLNRVIHLTLDHWQNLPAANKLSKSFDGGGQAEFNVIEPGNAEIHAVVNVTYEIIQME